MNLRLFLKSLLSPGQRQIILKALYMVNYPRDYLFCLWKFGYWRRSWVFRGLPRIHCYRRGSIRIGKRFTCTSSWRFNSIGVFQPTTLKCVTPDARLVLGDDFGVSGASISCSKEIFIGDRVMIGSGCLITDSDAHAVDPRCRFDSTKVPMAPVQIGDDVFVGARAIILKGVTIGSGSVIGAGSVVVKDIPAGVIAAGNPARVIREINMED